MIIKNISSGPRGFWLNGAFTVLDAGAEADLEIGAADAKALPPEYFAEIKPKARVKAEKDGD